MKDSELCQQSIEHWERMIEYMKWFVESNIEIFNGCNLISELMGVFEKYVGESWSSSYCNLCVKYYILGFWKCINCPLSKINKRCEIEFSPWYKIYWSTNEKEWIKNAEECILPALKEAKEYCLQKEKECSHRNNWRP